MDSESRNKWFVAMGPDERTSFRNVGFLVLGYGAVLTLLVSSFSRPLIVFGLAPAIVGLLFVVLSFIPVPKPPPMHGVILLLNIIVCSLGLFGSSFGFHLSRRAAVCIGVAYAILVVCLYFWRPTKRSAIVSQRDKP